MDTLRLILLVIGAIIIGGMLIYYWVTSVNEIKATRLFSIFKFPRTSSNEEIPESPPSHVYEDEPDEEDIAALSGLTLPLRDPEVSIDDLGPISALPEEVSLTDDRLIVVLNVMAKQGIRFHGLDILNAMREQGFEFGDMNLFHYFITQENKQRPLCSVANTVEPGTFDIEHMTEMETPGLSLFMQLPGPMEDRLAFDRMLQLARVLTGQLDGILCDESRSKLTMQAIGHLKEKIDAFHFKHKMSSVTNHQQQ